jgi:hypothetical protein
MMVKHALAQEPSAGELESTCRALVERDKPFIPEIAELMQCFGSSRRSGASARWRSTTSTISIAR